MEKLVISELENRLKLTSALGITNMHMFNENGKMQKFKDIDEIIDQQFPFRSGIYVKRRDYMLKKLQKNLISLNIKQHLFKKLLMIPLKSKMLRNKKSFGSTN